MHNTPRQVPQKQAPLNQIYLIQTSHAIQEMHIIQTLRMPYFLYVRYACKQMDASWLQGRSPHLATQWVPVTKQGLSCSLEFGLRLQSFRSTFWWGVACSSVAYDLQAKTKSKTTSLLTSWKPVPAGYSGCLTHNSSGEVVICVVWRKASPAMKSFCLAAAVIIIAPSTEFLWLYYAHSEAGVDR